MDIFVPIAICFILFVFFSLCGMCCKRRRDAGAVIATPVVITSTQHHVAPYPVTQIPNQAAGPPMMQQHATGTGVYPMPQPMYNSMPGVEYPRQQQPMQQQQMYPAQQGMPMPMPMPQPGGISAPMAPPVAAQAMMDPPSYDQVVTENYPRQAAYNPHYTGGQ
ncbi:uncharacterized protein LOC129754533 [Uranotaenia lowii]|uniref:uncharacterized protein LOC129754533 n=1 Tax=Uranotaenia lowii TaxID=190385 RepID=UPI00247905C4|nr:uncharacterized protein LOC129754533 [Uranotaenia lowii]